MTRTSNPKQNKKTTTNITFESENRSNKDKLGGELLEKPLN